MWIIHAVLGIYGTITSCWPPAAAAPSTLHFTEFYSQKQSQIPRFQTHYSDCKNQTDHIIASPLIKKLHQEITEL